jgi:large subunit ribosomal protein L24
MSIRLKKGDTVKVIAGKFKGQTGKIVAISPRDHTVKVEGLNIVKRAQKPNMISPQGGITSIHKPLDVSKVALTHPSNKSATSRVSYRFKKDRSKVRVYAQANNKEIDS